ncbi:MAG: hypothetical protein OXC30_05350 [Alphaproteobacteria bacterium]|nr:hypothetical protein [Alphaproteobacteria bacterium]
MLFQQRRALLEQAKKCDQEKEMQVFKRECFAAIRKQFGSMRTLECDLQKSLELIKENKSKVPRDAQSKLDEYYRRLSNQLALQRGSV